MTMTLEDRYIFLSRYREEVVNRGRRCAELSIPSLLPESGFSESSELPLPYQSLGARAVANLSSRLTTALLPPGVPSFRLEPDDEILSQASEQGQLQEINEALFRREILINNKIQASNIRQGLNLGLQHLVAIGNCALYLTPEYNIRIYRIDQYVCRRMPDGSILEVICEDYIDLLSIPKDVADACNIDVEKLMKEAEQDPNKAMMKIYTQQLSKGKNKGWQIVQEMNKIQVPGSLINRSEMPIIPSRYHAIAGEHYGRGQVEENLGDLRSYEGLQKAMVEAAAIMARIVFLVNEVGGYTRIADVSSANNGDFKCGREEDVTVLESEKARDLSVAQAQAKEIENRLGYAFLLNSAVQPEGERVTAYQVQKLIAEIEGTLGGIYTSLSQELQLPLIKAIIDQMERDGSIQRLPKDSIKPIILTGLETLGREQDLIRLQTVTNILAPYGEQGLSAIKLSAFTSRLLLAVGIDPSELVYTEQELAQRQQQQLLQEQAANVAGAAGQAAAKAAGNGQTQ